MSGITILTACVAFVLGLVVAFIIVRIAAQKEMVVEHKSRYNFEETIERLKKAVEKADGWVLPIPEWHFSDAMIKHNKPFTSVDRLIVFFVCKADYAREMINYNPAMASFMPCGWAVYERDGVTYIGAINISLMALPFEKTRKKVFCAVGEEEEEMFKDIL